MWLLYISLSSLLAGAILAVVGWRGKRVDDHPVCRGWRCGFDLSGAVDLKGKCPECGRDLAARRAVKVGNRRPLKSVMIAGALLGLAAPAPLGLFLPWSHSPKVVAIKPSWMLELDTYVENAVDPALSELLARQTRGKLSDATLARLARHGLRLQADRDIPWRTRWGELIARACQRPGLLAPEEIVASIRNSVVVDAPIVDRARVGDPVTMTYRIACDRGAFLAALGFDSVGRFSWAGVSTQAEIGFGDLAPVTSGAGREIRVPDVPSGPLAGKLTVAFTARDTSDRRAIGEPWTVEVPFSIRVVARDQELVELVTGEAVRREVERALSINELRLEGGSGEETRIRVTFMVRALPVSVVSRMFAAVRAVDTSGNPIGKPIEVSFGRSALRLDATGAEDPGGFRGFYSEPLEPGILREFGTRVRVDLRLTPDRAEAQDMGVWRIVGEQVELAGPMIDLDASGTAEDRGPPGVPVIGSDR